jgi:excisionase family DNA binding protein
MEEQMTLNNAVVEYKPRARSMQDAARTLGVNRSLLYKMAKRGELELIKLGGRTIVDEREIDRLLEEGDRLYDKP